MPSFSVAERPDFADDAWTLRVSLPTGLDADRFAAAMAAENLPCAAGDHAGTVRLPLGPAYSGEDVEHLVLAVAKVAHYLSQDGRAAAH